MSKIIIAVGLPASGKTTWALEQARTKGYKVVCKDDIRKMFGGFKPSGEKFVLKTRDAIIQTALDSDHTIIVADTNLNPTHVERIKNVFGKEKVEIKSFLDVPLEECIKRDIARQNSVGEKVIREMYNKWVRKIQVYDENPDLPKAIIVDIDGTLAIADRSPYDWDKVGQDKVNGFVVEIVRRFSNTHKILIFSGRDSVCKKLTEDWLQKNIIPYDELQMRPEGNMERDTVVKKRMFDSIRGKYYVDFVIDDRLCMKRLWTELGLNLLGIGDPDADF